MTWGITAEFLKQCRPQVREPGRPHILDRAAKKWGGLLLSNRAAFQPDIGVVYLWRDPLVAAAWRPRFTAGRRGAI